MSKMIFNGIVVKDKAAPKPYGEVKYADPANGRYPIDTEEHIRAAWSYINMPKNAAKVKNVASVKASIINAWKKKIDPAGPPSVAKGGPGSGPQGGNGAHTEPKGNAQQKAGLKTIHEMTQSGHSENEINNALQSAHGMNSSQANFLQHVYNHPEIFNKGGTYSGKHKPGTRQAKEVAAHNSKPGTLKVPLMS